MSDQKWTADEYRKFADYNKLRSLSMANIATLIDGLLNVAAILDRFAEKDAEIARLTSILSDRNQDLLIREKEIAVTHAVLEVEGRKLVGGKWCRPSPAPCVNCGQSLFDCCTGAVEACCAKCDLHPNEYLPIITDKHL